MAGRSTDPKNTRITVRLGDGDMKALAAEARRRGVTVGAIVRDTIRIQFKLGSVASGRRQRARDGERVSAARRS